MFFHCRMYFRLEWQRTNVRRQSSSSPDKLSSWIDRFDWRNSEWISNLRTTSLRPLAQLRMYHPRNSEFFLGHPRATSFRNIINRIDARFAPPKPGGIVTEMILQWLPSPMDCTAELRLPVVPNVRKNNYLNNLPCVSPLHVNQPRHYYRLTHPPSSADNLINTGFTPQFRKITANRLFHNIIMITSNVRNQDT